MLRVGEESMYRFIALFFVLVSTNVSAATKWNCSTLAHWEHGQLVSDYKTVSILEHDWSTDTISVQVDNAPETLVRINDDWYQGPRFAYLPMKDYFLVRATGSSAICKPHLE
jgi:hypothetical protein